MRSSRAGDVAHRFWSRVEKRGPEECWNWSGKPSASGYGRIGGELNGERIAEKCRTQLAHRVSWLIHNGPIPTDGPAPHGWVVMHKCDNRLCVNPAHLELGSQADNVKDMDAKKRANRVSRSGLDNPRFALTADQLAEVLQSRERSADLANRFGVCKTVIQRARKSHLSSEYLSELEQEIRRRGAPKGADVANARLADQTVRQIRASDITNEKWAALLGVSETTVAQARRRQTYRHVE